MAEPASIYFKNVYHKRIDCEKVIFKLYSNKKGQSGFQK